MAEGVNKTIIISETERLLRMAEVARILQIGKTSAYRLIQNGILNCVRFSGTVRVRKIDLDQFILDHLVPSSELINDVSSLPAPSLGTEWTGQLQGGYRGKAVSGKR